jgi:hypothetical protein
MLSNLHRNIMHYKFILNVFADGYLLSFLGWGSILDRTKPFILQNGTFVVESQNSFFYPQNDSVINK